MKVLIATTFIGSLLVGCAAGGERITKSMTKIDVLGVLGAPHNKIKAGKNRSIWQYCPTKFKDNEYLALWFDENRIVHIENERIKSLGMSWKDHLSSFGDALVVGMAAASATAAQMESNPFSRTEGDRERAERRAEETAESIGRGQANRMQKISDKDRAICKERFKILKR